MFIITSDSVSVADCAAAVEQVAKEQRASLDLVYLMSAIVSKKPNSAEEVMRALEGFTAHGGWEGCEKGVWDLLMQFVQHHGEEVRAAAVLPVAGAAEAGVRAVPGEQGLGDGLHRRREQEHPQLHDYAVEIVMCLL